MVRGKFDSSVQQETGGFDNHRNIAGFYSHFRPWSARLPENHRFLTRATMPIDDPELPFRFEDCRNASRQAQLVRDAVEGVCEKDVIDRLRHDRIESHGVRQDKTAVGRTSRSNKRPRAIQHGRVDVDGVDAIHDAGERGREQPISATQINHDHAGPHAHFDKNRHGIRPQRLPPIGIRHCCCREKADYHAILKGFYFLQASGGIEVGLHPRLSVPSGLFAIRICTTVVQVKKIRCKAAS
jgi:hypothetical protein